MGIHHLCRGLELQTTSKVRQSRHQIAQQEDSQGRNTVCMPDEGSIRFHEGMKQRLLTTRILADLLGNFFATSGMKSLFIVGPLSVMNPIGTFTIGGFLKIASSAYSSGVLHCKSL